MESRRIVPYLQGRNGDTDIENGLDTAGKRESGTNWEGSIDIHYHV